ncbi:MAG: hypothetical protein FD138_2399 [Planctomycetota bacterium]|nr:MAG: hypothetical protein FD138_2399 [Planctomycetota bacterium]
MMLVWTVLLLTLSNIFMTFAWYGHLKWPEIKSGPLWIAIGVSWAIALFEYCLQVPANRIGHREFPVAQLKIMQEAITLVVFCGFSILFLRESLKWNDLAAFACIFGAVFFAFLDKWQPDSTSTASQPQAEITSANDG